MLLGSLSGVIVYSGSCIGTLPIRDDMPCTGIADIGDGIEEDGTAVLLEGYARWRAGEAEFGGVKAEVRFEKPPLLFQGVCCGTECIVCWRGAIEGTKFATGVNVKNG